MLCSPKRGAMAATIALNPSFAKRCVPEGLQDLLEGLAREILRRKPSNTYKFAALYFDNLFELRTQAEATGRNASLKEILVGGKTKAICDDQDYRSIPVVPTALEALLLEGADVSEKIDVVDMNNDEKADHEGNDAGVASIQTPYEQPTAGEAREEVDTSLLETETNGEKTDEVEESTSLPVVLVDASEASTMTAASPASTLGQTAPSTEPQRDSDGEILGPSEPEMEIPLRGLQEETVLGDDANGAVTIEEIEVDGVDYNADQARAPEQVWSKDDAEVFAEGSDIVPDVDETLELIVEKRQDEINEAGSEPDATGPRQVSTAVDDDLAEITAGGQDTDKRNEPELEQVPMIEQDIEHNPQNETVKLTYGDEIVEIDSKQNREEFLAEHEKDEAQTVEKSEFEEFHGDESPHSFTEYTAIPVMNAGMQEVEDASFKADEAVSVDSELPENLEEMEMNGIDVEPEDDARIGEELENEDESQPDTNAVNELSPRGIIQENADILLGSDAIEFNNKHTHLITVQEEEEMVDEDSTATEPLDAKANESSPLETESSHVVVPHETMDDLTAKANEETTAVQVNGDVEPVATALLDLEVMQSAEKKDDILEVESEPQRSGDISQPETMETSNAADFEQNSVRDASITQDISETTLTVGNGTDDVVIETVQETSEPCESASYLPIEEVSDIQVSEAIDEQTNSSPTSETINISDIKASEAIDEQTNSSPTSETINISDIKASEAIDEQTNSSPTLEITKEIVQEKSEPYEAASYLPIKEVSDIQASEAIDEQTNSSPTPETIKISDIQASEGIDEQTNSSPTPETIKVSDIQVLEAIDEQTNSSPTPEPLKISDIQASESIDEQTNSSSTPETIKVSDIQASKSIDEQTNSSPTPETIKVSDIQASESIDEQTNSSPTPETIKVSDIQVSEANDEQTINNSSPTPEAIKVSGIQALEAIDEQNNSSPTSETINVSDIQVSEAMDEQTNSSPTPETIKISDIQASEVIDDQTNSSQTPETTKVSDIQVSEANDEQTNSSPTPETIKKDVEKWVTADDQVRTTSDMADLRDDREMLDGIRSMKTEFEDAINVDNLQEDTESSLRASEDETPQNLITEVASYPDVGNKDANSEHERSDREAEVHTSEIHPTSIENGATLVGTDIGNETERTNDQPETIDSADITESVITTSADHDARLNEDVCSSSDVIMGENEITNPTPSSEEELNNHQPTEKEPDNAVQTDDSQVEGVPRKSNDSLEDSNADATVGIQERENLEMTKTDKQETRCDEPDSAKPDAGKQQLEEEFTGSMQRSESSVTDSKNNEKEQNDDGKNFLAKGDDDQTRSLASNARTHDSQYYVDRQSVDDELCSKSDKGNDTDDVNQTKENHPDSATMIDSQNLHDSLNYTEGASKIDDDGHTCTQTRAKTESPETTNGPATSTSEGEQSEPVLTDLPLENGIEDNAVMNTELKEGSNVSTNEELGVDDKTETSLAPDVETCITKDGEGDEKDVLEAMPVHDHMKSTDDHEHFRQERNDVMPKEDHVHKSMDDDQRQTKQNDDVPTKVSPPPEVVQGNKAESCDVMNTSPHQLIMHADNQDIVGGVSHIIDSTVRLTNNENIHDTEENRFKADEYAENLLNAERPCYDIPTKESVMHIETVDKCKNAETRPLEGLVPILSGSAQTIHDVDSKSVLQGNDHHEVATSSTLVPTLDHSSQYHSAQTPNDIFHSDDHNQPNLEPTSNNSDENITIGCAEQLQSSPHLREDNTAASANHQTNTSPTQNAQRIDQANIQVSRPVTSPRVIHSELPEVTDNGVHDQHDEDVSISKGGLNQEKQLNTTLDGYQHPERKLTGDKVHVSHLDLNEPEIDDSIDDTGDDIEADSLEVNDVDKMERAETPDGIQDLLLELSDRPTDIPKNDKHVQTEDEK